MDQTERAKYRLFKYRSIADGEYRERTERLIRRRRIYYAAPKQFNDPFDCQVCFNFDRAPLSAVGLSKLDQISAHSNAFMRDRINEEIGVLSLTERNDSLLMWSHYSDCHAGICLAFEFDATAPLYRVRYSDARPQLYFADVREHERDNARFKDAVVKTMTTKASDWAYEKEWRCIDFGGPGERPMPRDMLTGIIFGCRTSDEDKAVVRGWVRSSGQNVAFYQAAQRDGTFTLEVNRVD